jgi:hypothetical protein
MKKLYKFLLISVLSSVTLFYSCDTIELEQLTSPNALSPEQADADLLLNNIQLTYRGSQRTFQAVSADLGRVDFMFGRNYLENYDDGTLNGPWNSYYSSNLPNLDAIAAIDAANPDKDYSFHLGVAKTLQAHTLMQLVDFLGDVPFSEAGNPAEFPKPTVDDDAAVYAGAIAMLAEAKVLFTNTSGAGTATDLFYEGSPAKWIKLVNTLQMRANLTTGNYLAVTTATNVIESSDDDFQFNYGTNVLAPDTRHPAYASDYTDSGANIYQSNWLISTMVGQYGDLSADTDPRRRYYFYRQNWRTPGSYALYEDVNGLFGAAGNIYISNGAGDGETLSCSLQEIPTHLQFTPDEDIWCGLPLGYWGRFHGNDEGTPPDNFTRTAVGVYPAGGSFDGRADAFPYVGESIGATFGQAVGLGDGGGGNGIDPIYLASYVDFMKAEANLVLGNTDIAADHFEAGMTKSIAKVQSFGAVDPTADMSQAPDAATVTGFIADKVAEFDAASTTTSLEANGFPTAKDKMDLLGEQYFIAMFGGAGDAFNFVRRTGYPRTLSRNVDPNPGSYPRTVLYPSNEVSANENLLQRTDLNTTVFWDTGVINPAN